METLLRNKEKLENGFDSQILIFKVFDESRSEYVAKVTTIDKIIDKVFLWAFPQTIKPNYITVFRFISIPFLVYFLLAENYTIAFMLFVVSALSDAIDGAIARTRNKITDWGIVFDPLADKLLIGSVGGILIFKTLNLIFALIIIFPDLILIISSYFRFKNGIIPAKIVGKIKMILQCFGIGFIFLFLLTGSQIFLIIATYILSLAVIFALLSIFVYKSI